MLQAFPFERAFWFERQGKDLSCRALDFDRQRLDDPLRRLGDHPFPLLTGPGAFSNLELELGTIPGLAAGEAPPPAKSFLGLWFDGQPQFGLYLDHRFHPPSACLDEAGRRRLSDLAVLLDAVLGNQRVEVPVGPTVRRDQLTATALHRGAETQQTTHSLRVPITQSVTHALLERILQQDPAAPSRLGPLGYLVGTSPALSELYTMIQSVADSTIPVLILGETGSGKEVVARAIHDLGPRVNKPFVAQNCGAMPKELAASIFFGHVKGAFTGADERRVGLFEQSHLGSLFLDEIGELGADLQTSLLRVIQERMVRPLGMSRELPVDFRLLAATNRVLRDEVKAGRFREDLFYRLQVAVLEVPPLRRRKEDLPILLDYFNRLDAEAEGRAALEFVPEALLRLVAHDWPGNIRELRNLVARLHVFHRGPVTAKVVEAQLRCSPEGAETAVHETFDSLQSYLDTKERAFILASLKASHGNVSRCAERLGIGRMTLYKKMKALGIERKHYLLAEPA